MGPLERQGVCNTNGSGGGILKGDRPWPSEIVWVIIAGGVIRYVE